MERSTAKGNRTADVTKLTTAHTSIAYRAVVLRPLLLPLALLGVCHGGFAANADVNVAADDLAIAGIVLIHDDCARSFPGLAAEVAPSYGAWRERNRDVLKRLDSNREYQARMKEDLERIERATKPGDVPQRAQLRDYCDGLLTALFEAQLVPAPESPQAAWNGLIAALRAGDLRKALAHYTGDARGRYRDVLETLGPEGMKRVAGDFGAIEKYETTQDLAFAYVSRIGPDSKRYAYEVSFMRDRRTGGWFIDSM